MGDRKGVNPDRRLGEEDLGIEESETIVRIYYMRKNLFLIKGKSKC